MGGMANHEYFEVQDLVNGELTAKRDAGGFSSEVYADAAFQFLSMISTPSCADSLV